MGTVHRLRARRRPGQQGRRKTLGVVLLLGLAILAAFALARRRRPPPPPPAVARPLEEHAGLCAAPPPPAPAPVPCPYVGKPGVAGAAIDYGAPFAGDPAITCLAAGALVMPTGQLVASDPFVFLDDRAFTIRVPPGTYPVILALQGDRSGDVALAMLKIRDGRPVRWEIGVLPGEKPGHHFYPVDTGTGCYVDRAVAREILARQEADPAGTDLLDLVHLAGYGARPAASLCIDAQSGGNLVAFRSGAGDGSYGVYVGYDATGAVAAFVTDFGLIEALEVAGDGGE